MLLLKCYTKKEKSKESLDRKVKKSFPANPNAEEGQIRSVFGLAGKNTMPWRSHEIGRRMMNVRLYLASTCFHRQLYYNTYIYCNKELEYALHKREYSKHMN